MLARELHQLGDSYAAGVAFVKRVARFGVVGLISTFAVQDPTLLVLAHLGVPKVAANEIGLILAAQCSFVLSARFVWPDRLHFNGRLGKRSWALLWVLFTTTALAASVVQDSVFSVLLRHGFILEAAFIGGVVVGVAVTFGVNNFFTFRAVTKVIHVNQGALGLTSNVTPLRPTTVTALNRDGVDLSIVIPAYREAPRIGDTLNHLLTFLQVHELGHVEVVVVTADSSDGTADIVDHKATLFGEFTHLNPGPKVGKGRDVREGVLAANGKTIVYMDADLATGLDYLLKVNEFVAQKGQVWVGVRDIANYPSMKRRILSLGTRLLAKALIAPGVPDTQCGFKIFDADIAHELFQRMTLMGWSFDMEILGIARQLGYDVRHFAIPDWHDPKPKEESLSGESAVHAALQLALDPLIIRKNLLTGKYRGGSESPQRPGGRTNEVKPLVQASAKQQRQVARGLAIGCSVLSIIAYALVARLGGVLLYNDAMSHLAIARRVTNGTSPGLAQLGAVWLPLPHLLMLPLVWITPLYQDGFAGSIGSMVAYVATALLIYKIVFRLTDQKVGAGIVGMGVFALNVNMLYMQATPMTESLLFALMAATVYFVQEWAFTESYRYLCYAGVAALFASLARYEAWALVMALTPVVGLVAWVQQRNFLPAELHWRRVADRLVVVFGVPASTGLLAWVVWNWVIFGSPFYFQFGPFSKPALWTPSTDPAVHHLRTAIATYWYAMQDVLGWPLLLLAFGSFAVMLVVQWRKGRVVTALPSLSMLIMVPFFVAMLYTGQRPLHVAQISPELSLYNVRYALIILSPVAISIGYLAGVVQGYWVGRGYRWAAIVITGIMLVALVGFGTSSLATRNVPTYNEPVSWESLPSDRDQYAVVRYLNEHYNEHEELLMESNGNEIVAFYEPANELVYEGTYQVWGQALHDPTGHNIRWIVARCGSSPDLVCTSDGQQQLSNYNLVFTTKDGVYRVYEIK